MRRAIQIDVFTFLLFGLNHRPSIALLLEIHIIDIIISDIVIIVGAIVEYS